MNLRTVSNIVIFLIFASILAAHVACQKPTDYVVDKIYKEKDPRTFKGIDPRLQEYVDRFTEDTGKRVDDIPHAIRSLNPGKDLNTLWKECEKYLKPWNDKVKDRCSYTAGTCFMNRTPTFKWYKWIIVDEQWYELYGHNDTKVEQMMYHELGHCVLNLDHVDSHTEDAYGNTWPNSIMRSNLFTSKELEYYELNKEYLYINELLEIKE